MNSGVAAGSVNLKSGGNVEVRKDGTVFVQVKAGSILFEKAEVMDLMNLAKALFKAYAPDRGSL